jgi:hypothetical protein
LIARRLLVAVAGLVLAVQVIRNAVVARLATVEPAVAARFWSGHPQAEISAGMDEIAQAVSQRKSVEPRTLAMIDDAAAKSPLSPEPLLVRGVQAQIAGNADTARHAFLEAQWRDPRSVPAAYFLAEYSLRAGHLLEGLRQTALLARLVPVGGTIAPFLAVYAQNRSTWPQIRALFRGERDLAAGVLAALAHDPQNTDAILALADGDNRRPDSAWLAILLPKLIEAGDYAKARAIWSSVGRPRPSRDLLYDSDFSAPEAPPPFNWMLASSTIGLAERQPGKRLHVLFYGNQDGVLASELLLLPAGTYRLQMRIAGAPQHAELLRWSVRCDKSTEPLASFGVGEAAGRGFIFQVPNNCSAQWIELSGHSADIAQQSDVTIGGLSLTRADANAR